MMIAEWDAGAGEMVEREMTAEEAQAWAAEQAAAAKPVVPQSVTMRQARLALLHAGKLGGVDAAIDALSSPQKDAARIEWDYARDVERHSPIVAMMGQALALGNQEMDELFIQAAIL